MRYIHAFLCAAPFLFGCSSPASDDSPVEQLRAPLEGAQPVNSLTFAVAVSDTSHAYTCSGVLLTPRLVLTARHCVDPIADARVTCSSSQFDSQTPDDGIVVSNCSDIASNGSCANWERSAAIFRPDNPGVCGNDIALIALSNRMDANTFAEPLFRNIDFSSAYAIAAYGAIDAEGNGIGERRILRYQQLACAMGGATGLSDCATTEAGWLLGDTIASGELFSAPGICTGDSGGGVFMDATIDGASPGVLAIVSREAPAVGRCPGAILTRVDRFESFIRNAAVRSASLANELPPAWATAAESSTSSAAGLTAAGGGCATCAIGSPGGLMSHGGCILIWLCCLRRMKNRSALQEK